MFKHIEFIFTEPICSCEPFNFKWGMKNTDSDFGDAIVIWCNTCKTKLVLPDQTLQATFTVRRDKAKAQPLGPQTKLYVVKDVQDQEDER